MRRQPERERASPHPNTHTPPEFRLGRHVLAPQQQQDGKAGKHAFCPAPDKARRRRRDSRANGARSIGLPSFTDTPAKLLPPPCTMVTTLCGKLPRTPAHSGKPGLPQLLAPALLPHRNLLPNEKERRWLQDCRSSRGHYRSGAMGC